MIINSVGVFFVNNGQSIFTAILTIMGGAILTTIIGLFGWRYKKRVDRDESRGPVLRKNEHDTAAKERQEVYIEAQRVMGQQIDSGFSELRNSITRVHERVDETQKLMVEVAIGVKAQ